MRLVLQNWLRYRDDRRRLGERVTTMGDIKINECCATPKLGGTHCMSCGWPAASYTPLPARPSAIPKSRDDRAEKRDLREIRDDIRTTRRGRFAWWLITVAARAVDLEIDDYIDNHGKGP